LTVVHTDINCSAEGLILIIPIALLSCLTSISLDRIVGGSFFDVSGDDSLSPEVIFCKNEQSVFHRVEVANIHWFYSILSQDLWNQSLSYNSWVAHHDRQQGPQDVNGEHDEYNAIQRGPELRRTLNQGFRSDSWEVDSEVSIGHVADDPNGEHTADRNQGFPDEIEALADRHSRL